MDTDLTLYYVGNSEAEAKEGMAFDSADSADSYRVDTNQLNIYAVSATVRWETIELVD